MKKGFYILLIMFTAMWVVSCDKTKSYTDMLKAQEKAIKGLIADSGYVVLDNFPKDSIFKSNEFVLLDNGIYLNIISKGTSERAVLYKTEVSTRFIARLFMPSSLDTGTVDNLGPHSNGTNPVIFKYGYNMATNTNDFYAPTYYFGPGLATALEYVGDSAVVKMIIPFKQLSSDFQSSGTPIFYQKAKFIFTK